jgi:hypothetical protein
LISRGTEVGERRPAFNIEGEDGQFIIILSREVELYPATPCMVNMMMRGDKLARLTRRRKRKLEIAVQCSDPL